MNHLEKSDDGNFIQGTKVGRDTRRVDPRYQARPACETDAVGEVHIYRGLRAEDRSARDSPEIVQRRRRPIPELQGCARCFHVSQVWIVRASPRICRHYRAPSPALLFFRRTSFQSCWLMAVCSMTIALVRYPTITAMISVGASQASCCVRLPLLSRSLFMTLSCLMEERYPFLLDSEMCL